MDLVIDANIIAAYSMETNGYQHDMTGSASRIFDSIGTEDRIYIDEGKQIESEWRRKVNEEWFDIWLGDLFLNDTIVEIRVGTHARLISHLVSKGFPRTRDVWYVRVGKAAAEIKGKSILVTEDMDFYDPKKKALRGEARKRVLKRGRGPIADYLGRREQVFIKCICNCTW